MPWEVERTNTFQRSYRNMGSEVRRRVDEAISLLLDSEDPRKLGLRKIGRWRGIHSYEIGRRFRILYRARLEDRTVELLDVGLHTIYR